MTLKHSEKRYLIITVDTEGDNMWRSMFSQNSVEHRISIQNGKFLPRFQRLCESYGFVPTYLVDYEMTESEPLREMARTGVPAKRLEIGMHMHAWSTPPYYVFPPERDATHFNPYIGEYPTEIIEQKVECLFARLKDAFHLERITSHRSGRWQLDARYAKILRRHGIFADCSVTPGMDWSDQIGQTKDSGGSDYRDFPKTVYEMDLDDISKSGKSGFFEVPVTVEREDGKVSWLRPTGRNLSQMLALVERKSEEQVPYLEFMIHSAELMPFGSPTFPSEGAIEKLYQDMEQLFARLSKEYRGIGLSDYVQEALV